jgi:hypothetical protein
MFLAFVILIPFGVLTAYSFKNWQPYWFYVHNTVMCLGWIVALGGLAVGLVLVVDQYVESIHRWIGISVVIAVSVQVRALLCWTALR